MIKLNDLIIRKRRFGGIHVLDQHYLNNGGHNEYIIFKFDIHKIKSTRYCLVEYDIYGKSKSEILLEDEIVLKFGQGILEHLPSKPN